MSIVKPSIALKKPFWLFWVLTGMFLVVAPALQAREKTILVLGDSLSAAYNLPVESGWVSLLADRLEKKPGNYSVVNASISGETTSGGLARLPALLEQHGPDILILELGGNDGLRGYPPKAIYQNLEAMIDMATDANASVLLAGMRIPPNYGKRYTDAFQDNYRRLGKRKDVTLIPFFLEGVGGRAELIQSDGIHPKAEAQPILLANILPCLESLLEAKAAITGS